MTNRYTLSTVRDASDTDVVAPFLEVRDAEAAIKMLTSGQLANDDLWWMMLGTRTELDIQEDGNDPVIVDHERPIAASDA